MKSFHYVDSLPTLSPLKTEEINNKRYYISPTGEKYPSVTTVLGHFQKQQLKEWRARVGEEEANKISRKAATRGTKFHNLMEKYLRNEKNILENIMPDMQQAFFDMKTVVDKIDNIHYIECSLYSTKLKIAGRTDVIAEFDGKLSIIDFKTSLREKQEDKIQNYFEQTTAYAEMYGELVKNPIDQIVVLISVDHIKEPQVFIKNKKEYLESLCDKINTFQKEYGLCT